MVSLEIIDIYPKQWLSWSPCWDSSWRRPCMKNSLLFLKMNQMTICWSTCERIEKTTGESPEEIPKSLSESGFRWNHPKVHVAYHSASIDTWSPYPHKQHRCPHILDLSPGRISSVGRNFSNPTWWSPFIVSTSEETELDRDDAHVVGTSHSNICPTGQLFIISSFPNDPPSANKSRSHKIKELPSHWHANSKLTLEARVSKTIKGGWFHYYAAIRKHLNSESQETRKSKKHSVFVFVFVITILHDGMYNIQLRVNSNRWKGKVVFGIDFLFTFWFDLSRIRAKQRHPEEPVVPEKEK